MSHHSDPVEENIETHPVKLAIAVTVGSVGLVIGIVLLAYYSIGTHRVGESAASANSAEAIKARIAPLVRVAVDETKGPVAGMTGQKATAIQAGNKPGPAAGQIVAAVIPPAGPVSQAASGGEGTYKTACASCHAAGLLGAPKTGDKAAWNARLAKGKTVLYDHAIKGFNTMPPKGGQTALPDADVRAAVDYLLAQSK
jgi:cytochrome c5